MAGLVDLPAELLHIIVGELYEGGHLSTLKSLRLVCHRLCECIDPLLFSSININLHHLTKATSLLESLARERSAVNRHVKHLGVMSLEQRYEGHDVNAIHAAWSNFKASKYICAAIQALDSVESVEFHVCKYNPHSSSIAVMDTLTEMPSINTLRLTEDFGTVWRDIRFDRFTSIVDLSIEASTGYFIEQNLPNFMVNNSGLERLCIKFCPSYGRLGWSLDMSEVFGELKNPMALEHLEFHGRWKLTSAECLQYLPNLSSICLSDDDDKGKSLELLLKSLKTPIKRLSLPNGAREKQVYDIVSDFLCSYTGLEELTMGPSGFSSEKDSLKNALTPHTHTLRKLSWEQAMFTCSEFDFSAVSQLHNLQTLSVTLISSMKNIVMGEVLRPTVYAWLDVATSLPQLEDLNVEVIRRPRSHLTPSDAPLLSIDLAILQYAISPSSPYNPSLHIHTLSNCYRQLAVYRVDNHKFTPASKSKNLGYNIDAGDFNYSHPPCRPDYGDVETPFRLWGAALVSFCLGYWLEAYPSGMALVAMTSGCCVVTLGMEIMHTLQSSSTSEEGLFSRLTSVPAFLL
ncbi:hypothetical protein CYLTODRAFT_443310, partial [Cylindrobasidium torrendii FP15055 ss-10]